MFYRFGFKETKQKKLEKERQNFNEFTLLFLNIINIKFTIFYHTLVF